ncbi:MAG: S41 family peptidase [Pseudomonadota bacterium]
MFEFLLVVASLPTSVCTSEAETLRAAATQIEIAYVLEDVASSVAKDLRSYADETPSADDCAPKEDFARILTKTLRTISKDKHFYVEETTDDIGDDWIPAWRASGYEQGQGITHVEVIEGNIGYVRIKSFHELEPAFPHYRAAFDMVADTRALILDLRDNHGGSPETAWPVQWTFLAPGSPSPMKMESRIEAPTLREEPPVLWQRYGTERPMAILTNGDTFSAPEAVAYTLQAAGRAKIVGEPSGGGAHMLNDGDELGTGFTLYIPTSRPVSAVTGGNWEGTGVSPDIHTSSAEAINVAADYLRSQIAPDISRH